MKKNFDYEALVEGLRKVPTFEIAEAIARKDFPLKLPERKWLTIFNSGEISQFRGIQSDMDATAMNRNKVDAEKNAITRAAHDASVSTPDMTFVHEVVNQQRNMAASFDAHLSDLDRLHAQRMASQVMKQELNLKGLLTSRPSLRRRHVWRRLLLVPLGISKMRIDCVWLV